MYIADEICNKTVCNKSNRYVRSSFQSFVCKLCYFSNLYCVFNL